MGIFILVIWACLMFVLIQIYRATSPERWRKASFRKLPARNLVVLWRYEKGVVASHCIPENAKDKWIRRFLNGSKKTGPVTHWKLDIDIQKEGEWNLFLRWWLPKFDWMLKHRVIIFVLAVFLLFNGMFRYMGEAERYLRYYDPHISNFNLVMGFIEMMLFAPAMAILFWRKK